MDNNQQIDKAPKSDIAPEEKRKAKKNLILSAALSCLFPLVWFLSVILFVAITIRGQKNVIVGEGVIIIFPPMAVLSYFLTIRPANKIRAKAENILFSPEEIQRRHKRGRIFLILAIIVLWLIISIVPLIF